ncbi:MAG: Crp/Fnr family transcriptional regulator [Acidobacteriota bacterium]
MIKGLCVIETLKKVSFFSKLKFNVLEILCMKSELRNFNKGEIIFLEDDFCDGLFIIHKGTVKIYKSSGEDREQVLTIEKEGRPIAELSVFDEGPFPASAEALEPTTLIFIPKRDLKELCYKFPEIFEGIIRSLSERLRKMVHLIEDLAFLEVKQRLAKYLIKRAEESGVKEGERIILDLKLTNQELASQIGTVREIISRSFKKFRNSGIIQSKGKKIIIMDFHKLKKEAEII